MEELQLVHVNDGHIGQRSRLDPLDLFPNWTNPGMGGFDPAAWLVLSASLGGSHSHTTASALSPE